MYHLTTEAPEQSTVTPASEYAAMNNKLHRRIVELVADLEECREFIEGYCDVEDGDYGEQAPNKAMRLCNMIDETLYGPGGF